MVESEIQGTKVPLKVLELFSGTHSIGKVCKEKGWQVVSLDIHKADINCNIMEWDYKEAYKVGEFDIITASPPCETFSHARRSNIGRPLKALGGEIATRENLDADMIARGVPILRKTEEIIDYFKPKYYWIENPQTGKMKDFLQHRPHYDVDYCKYGFDYRKRTRFWTNIENFEPQKCKQDCHAIIKIEKNTFHKANCGNSHYQKLHKTVLSGKGARSHTTLNERYRIPSKLIEELFDRCDLST